MTNVSMIDLGPAARHVTTVLAAVTDEQLSAATPCADTTVGDLLDHLVGLTFAFRCAAQKASPGDIATRSP